MIRTGTSLQTPCSTAPTLKLFSTQTINISISIPTLTYITMAPSRTTEPDSPPNGTQPPTPETTLWEIAPIPGKGLGLIATQDITPGTLLLSEEPLLTTEGV